MNPIHITLVTLASLAVLVPLCSSRVLFRTPNSYNNFMRNINVLDFEKAKVEIQGDIFKRHVQQLRHTPNKQVELVFLIDSSGTVGPHYFSEEIRFVRNLLADFTVDVNSTRVSVITFSSPNKIFRPIDYMTRPDVDNHKCQLLNEDLFQVNYTPGGTNTRGAFLEAERVLRSSRPNATKAIFLMTDGYSNGGDPRPVADRLKKEGVKIFTFGIRDGFVWELQVMASEPKNETCYILNSFEEFEALAKRALHADLQSGSYIQQSSDRCGQLCRKEGLCCHANASCSCGTYTGRYECLCAPGYYGTGRGKTGCKPCPPGTYKNFTGLGDSHVCTPCPDEHQTTPAGAVSLKECVCKRGYRSFGNQECTVFRCPELSPPKYGYFVNNKCNNVFNAACGLRCQHGYELRGSSVRICQDDGTWSGQDAECIMKTCPSLPPPKNGHMICSSDDFSYSTVCRFTCNAGYQLVGSRKRTCLAIAFWTGIATRCREITCPPLVEIKDGSITPQGCTIGEVVFGTTCEISCFSGYTLLGPHTKQCTPDGTWMALGEGINQCIDETPPVLRCPKNREILADEFEELTEVIWTSPVPVDNSGFRPMLTSDPAVSPGSKFPIGITTITYKAEDLSQNIAQCKFSINIVDKTPPTVDECISPPPVISKEEKTEVHLELPVFSDNSGKPVEVAPSHKSGDLFPWGTTEVTYKAFDSSNNNSTCTIEVVVIPHRCIIPEPPVNGNATCEEGEIGVLCHITCQEGYAFAVPPAEEYFCEYEDGRWLPENSVPFPDCAVIQISNDILQPTTISLTGDLSCKDRLLISQIEQELEGKMEEKLSSVCENDLNCSVGSLKSICEDEEDFNKIQVVPEKKKRKKRSVREYTYKARERRDTAKKKSRLTFDFMLEGSYKKNKGVQSPELPDSLIKMLTSLQREAQSGNLDLRIAGRTLKYSGMSYDVDSHTYRCPEGSVLVNETCVNCPVGTFFHVVTERCEDCPKGTYQPMEGHNTCLRCPDDKSTATSHAKSENECKALCLPGTKSATGVEPCETCHLGFYQSDYAARYCHACSQGMTTHRRGSRKEEDCLEICPAGQVSVTGLAPCFKCPRNTYQQKSGQTECIRCPSGGTTHFPGATSKYDCITPSYTWEMQSDSSFFSDQKTLPFNTCFRDPCKNNGTCSAGTGSQLFKCTCLKGFTGTTCETVLDMCEAQPCLNSGSCVSYAGGYMCNCADGFEGEHCEINIDECGTSPCENNGVCVDGINSFTCNCPPGYTGETCSDTVNDCADAPCRNGGTCVNTQTGFECLCESGYTGETCEIDDDECVSSPCLNGGSCQDLPGKYSCTCVRGYEGQNCETEIDECADSPCQGGAVCEDLIDDYRCVCPSGYTGKKCETELQSQYQLDFANPSIMDYAELSIDQPLSTVSVSLWLRTTDKVNQGTPFSYAVFDEPNALTFSDYQSPSLYINGEVTTIYTGQSTLNDGRWHHIALIWSSIRGDWKAYVDGVTADQGFDLSTAKPIPGKGKFIVGQEQDSLGGGFSPSETFVGTLTHLNVWDRELALSEIENLMFDCEGVHEGNVIAWPDVQAALKGDIGTNPSSFCNECPTPENPDNGEVSYSSTKPGSTAVFSCDIGYYLGGKPDYKCLITGTWDGTFPQCYVITCRPPGFIRNGYYIGHQFPYGSQIEFHCNAGYELDGPDRLTCTEWGSFDGDPPECVEIQCTLPPLSENTVASTTQTRFGPGTRVDFTCRTGSLMQTKHTSVRCQRDGSWDRSVPSCDPAKCGYPPSIENGEPFSVVSEYNVGDIARYQCDFGYEFDPSASNSRGTINCLPSGDWSTDLPVCRPITCPDPPFLLNTVRHGADRTFMSVVNYTCVAGYEPQGTSVVECQEDRTWSKPSFRCIILDCGEPPNLTFGSLHYQENLNRPMAKDTIYNSIVNYQCDQGYRMVGDDSRRCEENAKWSGSDPFCEPMLCGDLSDIPNGHVEYTDKTYLSIAKYSCDRGFELDGFSELTCGASGQWLPNPPTCEPRSCPVPQDIQFGSYTASGPFVYNTSLEYVCFTGYELIGTGKSVCQEDGTWSEPPPQCQHVQCPELQDPQDGTVFYGQRTYRAIAGFACKPGFRMVGLADLTCQADGMWSSPPPTCQRSGCASPESPEHGNVFFKDLQVGSIVRYSCDNGYFLDGVSTRRCQTDLTFDGTSPECKPVDCGDLELVNGKISLSDKGTRFTSVATLSCDTGYTLEGDTTRTCESSGGWSGQMPVCNPVECTKISAVISNGRANSTDSTFGSVISYECDEGYNVQGSAIRKCQANGTWDEPIPVCESVECPTPRLIDGFVSSFQRSYGTVVKFSCKSSYRLVGPEERTCTQSGEWSGDEPQCLEIACEAPNPVSNSLIRVLNDTAIVYECNQGHTLVGEAVRVCGTDQIWRPDAPVCDKITCEDLSQKTFDNGNIVYTSNTFRDVVTYSCNTGYELRGEASRRCLATTKWEGDDPVCEAVDCGHPGILFNGRVIGSIYTFNNKLDFECKSGYKLVGVDSILCQSNGLWDEELPVCVEITCPDLSPTIPHGSVIVSDTSVYSMAEYQCDSGFHLIGDDKRECLETGAWSGKEPSCQDVFCPPPDPIEHGTREGDSFGFGDEIYYDCEEGYNLVGDFTRVCQNDGTWSNEAPRCLPVNCPEPTWTDNGWFLGESGSFNAVITYECEEGYELTGPVERKCLANATWSGEDPKCIRVSCGAPPVIDHAVMDQVSNVLFEARVVYSCIEGYSASGLDTTECLANRTWSYLTFQCTIITCPYLSVDNITHSAFPTPSFTFGSTVTISCEEGYDLNGYSDLECTARGAWSHQLPSCIIVQCPELGDLIYGTVLSSSNDFGSVASFICDTGYELIGAQEINCLSSGKWSALLPSCQLVSCPTPPSVILNGILNDPQSVYYYRDTCSYSCDKGYELQGDNLLTCLETGQFDKPPPSCSRIPCPSPDDVEHGTFTLFDNETVLYECFDGYELIGKAFLECLLGGKWSGLAPVCLAVVCPTPSLLADGHIEGNDYTYGHQITYICDPGFLLEGESVRVCQANQTWSGLEPKCMPVNCGKPPEEFENGIIEGEYFFGKGLVYSCLPGFELEGDDFRLCLEDGTWEGEVPFCQRLSCPAPNAIDNGIISGDSYLFEDMITYSCDSGYELQGNSERTCESSLLWSGAEPACTRISCGEPFVVGNGKIIGDSYLFGDRINVSCNFGYRLIGAESRVCQASGIWSGAGPVCEKILCPPPPVLKNSRSNASFIPDFYPVNDIIAYTCNSGYIMNGTGIKLCELSGQWSDNYLECYPVSCPVIDSLKHGSVIGDTYIFMSVLQFSCNQGFNLNGSSSLQCTDEGQWDSIPPHCEVIACPFLYIDYGYYVMFPQDASNITDDRGESLYIYGDVVSVVCDRGYEIQGKLTSECLIDGTWSNTNSKCTPVKCPKPSGIANAVVSDSLLTYGSTVNITCVDGYDLIGESTLTCRADRDWEEPFPQCVLLACGTPPVVENAILQGDNFRQGQTISYKCRAGYNLVGNNLLTCGATNMWLGSLPNCVEVDCGPPPVIPAATVTVGKTTFRSKANLKCNSGYIVQGNDTIVCSADGTWKYDPYLYCAPIDCGSPPDILHGTFTVDNTTLGNAAVYMCTKGYYMMGVSSLVCDETGDWVYEHPKCSPMDCLEPPTIDHATYTTNGTLFLAMAQYICDEGYSLADASINSISCTDQGIWQGDMPVCDRIECGTPPSIAHAYYLLDNNRTDYQSYAIYHCNVGYQASADDSYLTCNIDGKWEGERLSCQIISCVKPEARPHSTVSFTSLTYQSVATFSCVPGYQLVGESSPYCTEHGTWSSQPPDCSPKDCSRPIEIKNGNVKASGTTYGASATYTCHKGYQMQGSNIVYCGENGSWNSSAPVCKIIDCGAPANITHGHVSVKKTVYQSVAVYSCIDGYQVAGDEEITCEEDGFWNVKEKPHCVLITCPIPPKVLNGYSVYNNTIYGSVVEYACQSGYLMVGKNSLICGGTGAWLGDVPVCDELTCSVPTDIPNGFVNYNGTSIGAVAEYYCSTGFVIEGENAQSCLNNGTWSPEVPVCKRIRCAPPPVIANAEIIADTGRNITSKVTYSCVKGYKMVNDKDNQITITCWDDGDWFGKIPSCEIVVCYDLPPSILHSTYTMNGDTYTSQAFYTCDPGYTISGNPAIMCDHLGQWTTDNPPVCSPIVCGPPPVYDESTYDGADFTYSQTVIYTCNPGYDMVGPGTSVCQLDGNWSPVSFICEIRFCPPLFAIPENGGIVSGNEFDSFPVGSTMEFTCDQGFTMIGERTMRCAESGDWATDPPECLYIINLCSETLEMDNIRPPPPGKVTGDEYVVQCQVGYIPYGDMLSTCQSDGNWTIPDGTCERVFCGKPEVENPQNVMVLGRNYHYKDTVMFMCRYGYVPVHSPPILTCLASGDWDGKPECIASCKQDCLNGGFCVGLNRCKCLPGWAGPRCETAVCILPCLHGGHCVAPYKCACQPGYEGDRCQNAKCAKPCQNGGRCLWANKCWCPSGFSGAYCDKTHKGRRKMLNIT